MNGERILLLLLLVIMPNSAENKYLAQGGTEELDIRKEGQGLRSVLVSEYKVDKVVEAHFSWRPLAGIEKDGLRLVICEQAIPKHGVLGSVEIVPK